MMALGSSFGLYHGESGEVGLRDEGGWGEFLCNGSCVAWRSVWIKRWVDVQRLWT